MEIRNKTGYVNPRASVQGAIAAASSLQDFPCSQMAASAFVLFAALTQRLGISPSDAFERGAATLRGGDICREASALDDLIVHMMKEESK
jgi:hypothetical protein